MQTRTTGGPSAHRRGERVKCIPGQWRLEAHVNHLRAELFISLRNMYNATSV